MNTSKQRVPLNRSTSGSVLIIAIIFTTILAVVAIPTFLSLSDATLKSSNRVFYNVAALNLAEAGIEHGVQALKAASEGNQDWMDWQIEDTTAWINIENLSYSGSIQGAVKVAILNYAGETPLVVSKATIPMTHNSSVEKYMNAELSASSTRGLFPYGLLSRDFIQASGGVVFDSWISDPDSDPDTPYVPYSSSTSRDKVTIAAAGTGDGVISLGSSEVNGYAAVGSASNSGLSVTWGGQVGPADDSEWDESDTTELWKKNGWKVSTQTGALITNFTASFEEVTVPDVEATIPWYRYELPYNDSSQNNRYVSTQTIGSKGNLTVLELDEIVIKGNATLKIEGDVTIILPKENTTSLQVIQGGQIELDPDANLQLYIAGDIEISGAGILSKSAPQQLQIWGTSNTNQKFNFLNNAQFNGIIYAPNADFKVTGDSDFYGAIVSNSIILTGSGAFRYDESLQNYSGSGGGGGPTQVNYVEELVGIEREPYLELF
jgi:Tfp pilus assembly protein PilX